MVQALSHHTLFGNRLTDGMLFICLFISCHVIVPTSVSCTRCVKASNPLVVLDSHDTSSLSRSKAGEDNTVRTHTDQSDAGPWTSSHTHTHRGRK